MIPEQTSEPATFREILENFLREPLNIFFFEDFLKEIQEKFSRNRNKSSHTLKENPRMGPSQQFLKWILEEVLDILPDDTLKEMYTLMSSNKLLESFSRISREFLEEFSEEFLKGLLKEYLKSK